MRGTSSHSHFDALNLGLFAHDLPMICEQGYPLYTGGWPARWHWTSHTRSHATVTVDDACQQHCGEGRLLAFAGRGGVRMISAEAPCVYDNVSRYRRTVIAVEVTPEQTFVLDVFRVRGGRRHDYNVPVFFADWTAHGLDLRPGEDLYGGYVTAVQASRADRPWRVDFAIRSDFDAPVAGHLRIHGPASDATVMLGRGEARWGAEDPRRLPYLILQRANDGAELDSTFLTLYEPYREAPFLADDPVDVTHTADGVMVNIALADEGRMFTLRLNDAGDDTVTLRAEQRNGDERRSLMLDGIAPDQD